jgi:hypothetical protein
MVNSKLKHKNTIIKVVGVITVIGLTATGVGLIAVAGSGLAAAAGTAAWGAGAVATLGSVHCVRLVPEGAGLGLGTA